MRIDLNPNQPHKFVFTNKKAAFWYGETQQPHKEAYQGYTILEQRYVQDYTLMIDGEIISRSDAKEIILYPDRLVRIYPRFSETLHFVDSLNMLLVEITPKEPMEATLYFHFVEPIAQARWKWNSEKASFETLFTGFGLDKPTFLACTAEVDGEEVVPRLLDATRAVGSFNGGVGLQVDIENPAMFAALFAFSQPELHRMQQALKDPSNVLEVRRRRIQNLLNRAAVETGNAQLDLAYRWAVISLDDLVNEQRGKGIWAGLPWFNNYWGRDSFISFSGALLCTGQFETAREVLQAFSQFQNSDKASPFYGRIPNRVTLKEIIYNTADGTPWFVKACDDYLRYSGDQRFMEEMFPVIHRAVEGALLHHVDAEGFLSHGDAETWMDAVGGDGPWSPRGNRAVEIQALWYEQLIISRRWAVQLGFADLARKWTPIIENLQKNFSKRFWNEEKKWLFDHLNENSQPDLQVRPNQIFAVTVPRRPLIDETKTRSVISTVVQNLTFPWGVGSLWQHDPNFHPYHHYAPLYVPDAAYHNGVVWTWLSGPLLKALFPFEADLGYELLKNEAYQILNKDAVGGYSELLEAWPRKGEKFPRWSGTVSQAWSLAEFIRNIHQDLLGIQPDALGDTLRISPNLPAEISTARLRFRFGNITLAAHFFKNQESFRAEIQPVDPATGSLIIDASLPLGDEKRIHFTTPWNLTENLIMEIRPNQNILVNDMAVKKSRKVNRPRLGDLQFCQPDTGLNLAVFRGPGYTLIPPEQVVKRPGTLTRVVFDQSDPEHDDKGPNGNYIYPTHPAFKPGIFDGKRIKIWRDDSYFYFKIEYRELVNPGWRPESGYQLTFTAICLNFGHKGGLRRTRVGMNANYTIPFEYAYNYVIFVGNGYRIMNSQDEIIAEYRPQDNHHPIGFVKEKSVQFSVPAEYLPDLKLETAFVLIGGQDDHGAGGLGEFRSVGMVATEWQGAGGEQPQGNPSVYDVIEVR
ncbi:MAG: hypothetical protein Kow0042_15630 [Calditrichia bacterium]